MLRLQTEAAQLRAQGMKTAKRRNKRSNFKHRPDKSFTEARRARSKTDTTKPGLEDILIEASNNTGGEAEDSEMM